MITIDARQHPILVVQWTGELSTAEVDQFYNEVAVHLQRARHMGAPLCMVHLAEVDRVGVEVRRLLAERARSYHSDDLRSFVVLRSPIARGILIAIRWIEPSVGRSRIVGTVEQALREAHEAQKIPA